MVTAFVLRGVLSPFTHPLFTCMIGVGIGLAAWPLLAPIAGYAAAVILHARWNGSAILGSGKLFLNVYFLIMVPIFICTVWFVHWHRKREQAIVQRALPRMLTRQEVAGSDIERLASLTGQKAWRAQVRKSHGKRGARAIADYQDAVTELAFLRHARSLGTAGLAPAYREMKLIDILNFTRSVAVQRAGLPTIDSDTGGLDL